MQAQAPTHASLFEVLFFLSITVEVATFSSFLLDFQLPFLLFLCFGLFPHLALFRAAGLFLSLLLWLWSLFFPFVFAFRLALFAFTLF